MPEPGYGFFTTMPSLRMRARKVLGFTPSSSPPLEQQRFRLFQDDSGRAAITLVELGEKIPGGRARAAFNPFIADEIQRLLAGAGGRPALTINEGERRKPLDADDICVLVRKRGEVPAIEAALERRGVPHRYYRSPACFNRTRRGSWPSCCVGWRSRTSPRSSRRC